ncbi:MAG: hypothetical protein RR840_01400 [Clostridium sp.]
MKKAPNVVFGGISGALIIMFLYIGSIIPTNKIFLMGIAIGVGAIAYIKSGIKGGVTVYFASSILGFLLVPNKLFVGMYIIFGIYPLIKLLAERYSRLVEYIIKYASLNALTLLSYFIYSKIVYLGPIFENTYLILGFIIGLQILIFLFDFAFTKFIMFMEDRVLKKI